MVLGRVISALAEKQRHVPFRDSILTSLLRDSLQGQALCHFIGTLSPDDPTESATTLRLASQSVARIEDVGKADWRDFPTRIREATERLAAVHRDYWVLWVRHKQCGAYLCSVVDSIRGLEGEAAATHGMDAAVDAARAAELNHLMHCRRVVTHAATALEMKMLCGYTGKPSVKSRMEAPAHDLIKMERELAMTETQGHRCRTQLSMGEEAADELDCLGELFADIRSAFSLVRWDELHGGAGAT